MGFKLSFNARLVAFCLLIGVVFGAYAYRPINATDNGLNTSKESHSSSKRISADPLHRRPIAARSTGIESGRTPSVCNTVNYYWNSQSGRQSSCPFEWVVNYESRRIPERLIEQVCLSCGTCGQNHQCTQLKVHYQVYFRDTAEFTRHVVRAGCVCMPHEIGITAHTLEPF